MNKIKLLAPDAESLVVAKVTTDLSYKSIHDFLGAMFEKHLRLVIPKKLTEPRSMPEMTEEEATDALTATIRRILTGPRDNR